MTNKRKPGRPSAASTAAATLSDANAGKRARHTAATLLGARGGAIGGKARAELLTPAQREEFSRRGGLIGGKRSLETMSARARRDRARAAAQARWGKEQPA